MLEFDCMRRATCKSAFFEVSALAFISLLILSRGSFKWLSLLFGQALPLESHSLHDLVSSQKLAETLTYNFTEFLAEVDVGRKWSLWLTDIIVVAYL